ncbi:MAG: ATP-dependent DNA helicase RecG [Candidatus Portnoybacteria bacterium]|nr:ATP-dependent DNA helicase RecG [Candidatus Portnoybacteria bacterium]
MLSLSSKIENIRKVGPAYLKKLHRLNIKTIQDLFFHFPHRYDDFSKTVLISQLKQGQIATIQAKISEIKNTRLFHKKMVLTEALVKDKSGTIKIIWFNQPYLIDTLKKGKIANFSGKLTFAKKTLSLSNPVYEMVSIKTDTTHTGRIIPIYPETAGLSSRYLRYLIKPILYLTDKIPDFLPQQIKQEFNLFNLNQAIKQIHFPDNPVSTQKARQRLAFNEFFLIQLSTLKQKQKLAQEKASNIPFDQKLIKTFVKNLPFKLTDDQRITAWEILQDINQDKPMNRLLNGDVGSGKTIIAIISALETAKAGFQTALMAPTEILAKQHFETFNQFLKKSNLKIALLTSSEARLNKKTTSAQLKKKIAQGEADIIIGTHSLIQKGLSFKNLALTIIDEQHRFGVAQRAALQKRVYQIEDGLPTIPHLLSMTATPIPRTLALTLYGDLDISLIKNMPQGRKKIITKIITPNNRQKTYDFIRNQIKQKKQAFVICPLIDESEKEIMTEVKSVTQEYEKLSKKIFPQLKIAMLHGKLKPKEKENIMKEFQKRKTDILISTSVVEVGVDIPNATVMMIEGADRFGLAQLHQFRGRIGRGKDQSYCFLFTDSSTQKTNQRLKAITISQDGFELAEKDLKIRGAGDFLGTRQWGLPDLTMASLNDIDLIKQTRQAASMVLEKNLINPVLKEKLKNFQKNIHME